jgi:hypothetical protein
METDKIVENAYAFATPFIKTVFWSEMEKKWRN